MVCCALWGSQIFVCINQLEHRKMFIFNLWIENKAKSSKKSEVIFGYIINLYGFSFRVKNLYNIPRAFYNSVKKITNVLKMSLHFSKCVSKIKWPEKRFVRHCSEKPTTRHERDEMGPQKKIIHGEEYPEWAPRIVKMPGVLTSNFRVFQKEKPSSSKLMNILRNPPGLWTPKLKQWYLEEKEEFEAQNQSFVEERYKILGYDLAAAHFVLYRGGAVKFVGKDWTRKDPKQNSVDIPNNYNASYLIEKIDCESLLDNGLKYEGLMNFQKLSCLKWISLKNQLHIDDWCLDKLTFLTQHTLEYLDVRGCSVTHRGIQVLHRTGKLKLLCLNSAKDGLELELTCAMLQDCLPDLLIKFD